MPYLIPLLALLLFPLFPFAQSPSLVQDPFLLPADKIVERGIQRITLTSRPQTANKYLLLDEDYSVETVEFDRRGNRTRRYRKELGEYGLLGGEDESRNLRYEQDKIVSEVRELNVLGAVLGYRYLYEDGRLVEKKREAMGLRPYRELYEYDEAGRLARTIMVSRYASIATFEYEGDRLVQRNFFYDEDDEDPYTIAYYRYDERDTLREEAKILQETMDTIEHRLYNADGKVTYLREQRYANSPFGGDRTEYTHQEYYTYNERGQRQSVRFTPPEHVPFPDSMRFEEINYFYENDLLSQVDSFYQSHRYHRDARGQLEFVVSTDRYWGDTVAIDHYEFDDAGRLTMVYHRNYLEEPRAQPKQDDPVERHLNWMYYQDPYDREHSIAARGYDERGRLLHESQLRVLTKERCNVIHEHFPYYGKVAQYCDINARNLPSYVPTEVFEYYLNGNRDTIKTLDSYGNHDGSTVLSVLDTLIYQDGRIISLLRVGRDQNWDRASERYWIYDGADQLQEIYQTHWLGEELDTLNRQQFFYEGESLVRTVYSGWNERKVAVEYGPDQRIVRKLIYDQYGKEVRQELDYRYDDQGLLIAVDRHQLGKYDEEWESLRYEYEYW
ncbi:MAG: hypothetical protein AAFW73_00370 [Bacteroidota bacterium]